MAWLYSWETPKGPTRKPSELINTFNKVAAHTASPPPPPKAHKIIDWLPDHEACPGVWLIHPASLHRRKVTFSFPEAVSTNSFLVRDGTLCPPTSPLSAGTLLGLTLTRCWACHHSLWVHMCIKPVVFPWSSLRSATLTLPASSSTCIQKPWGNANIKTSRLEMSTPKSFTRYPLSSVHLWVYYYLLQEEVRVKWTRIRGYRNMSLGVILLLCSFSRKRIVGFYPPAFDLTSLRFLASLVVSDIDSISWGL